MFQNERQRMVAISIWVTCFSAGAMIGPVLGGIMLEHFSWGSVFLLNVPVMVLLMIVGPLLLPEYKDPKAGRLDLISAAMSLAAVLLLIFGLKKIAEYGMGSLPVSSLGAGIVMGALFVRRQRGLADPLIDLKLFEVPAFNAALVMNLLGCFIAFGAFYFVAQFLQLVMGLSPLKAGLWSIPSSIAFTVGTMLTPQIVRRVSAANVIAGGCLITAAGFVVLSRLTPTSSIGLVVTALFVYSIGLAPIFTLAADLIVGSAPPERAGAAASLNETSSEFGGAMGMAVLGTVGMAMYRSRVVDAFPAGIPAEAAKAARGTLGGAVEAAQSLGLGETLLHPARLAFTDALRFTSLACAVVAIAMAVIAATVLPRVKPRRP